MDRKRSTTPPSSLQPLAAAVDHIVWSVENLDEAVEQLVERMGFPLLYGPADCNSMRVADIGLGAVWVRLVEKAEWRTTQPLSLALEAAIPLDDAEGVARQRGFESGGVFVSPGRGSIDSLLSQGDSGSLPFVVSVLLRGVVAPREPGLLLVRYFHEVQARRIGECMRFFDSPAAAYGILGMVSVRVEVSEEQGVERWARVLGCEPTSCRNCWKLSEAGTVEAVLGGSDRISSIVLQAPNLPLLRNAWRDAGVESDLCGDALIVRPSSAGGLQIQVREKKTRRP